MPEEGGRQCAGIGCLRSRHPSWDNLGSLSGKGEFELGLKDEWTLDQEDRGAPRAGGWRRESPGQVEWTDPFGWSRGTGRRSE